MSQVDSSNARPKAEGAPPLPVQDNLLMEEFKLVVVGSTTNFQVLASWFSWFFGFQLVAIGYVANNAGAFTDSKWLAISGAFVCFHAFCLFVIWHAKSYFVTVSARVKALAASISDHCGVLHQYPLYLACATGTMAGLAVSTLV